MGGDFKLVHNRPIRRLVEPHYKMGLPALDAGCDFSDSPSHGVEGGGLNSRSNLPRLTMTLCRWIPFSAMTSAKSSTTSSILALCASLRNRLAPDERSEERRV